MLFLGQPLGRIIFRFLSRILVRFFAPFFFPATLLGGNFFGFLPPLLVYPFKGFFLGLFPGFLVRLYCPLKGVRTPLRGQ